MTLLAFRDIKKKLILFAPC